MVQNLSLPFNLKKSRKALFMEYLCGIGILVFLYMLYNKGIIIPPELRYLVIAFSLSTIGYAELSRFFLRYRVDEDKITITHGIIKQDKKNVHFHPLSFVPDINVRQGILQRLLNYGTIYVKSGGEKAFEIKDVNHPQMIMNIIESLIEKRRRGGESDDNKNIEKR